MQQMEVELTRLGGIRRILAPAPSLMWQVKQQAVERAYRFGEEWEDKMEKIIVKTARQEATIGSQFPIIIYTFSIILPIPCP